MPLDDRRNLGQKPRQARESQTSGGECDLANVRAGYLAAQASCSSHAFDKYVAIENVDSPGWQGAEEAAY